MILLSPCQYESMKRELDILRNEKLKIESTHNSNQGETPVSNQVSTAPSTSQDSSISSTDPSPASNRPSIEQVVSILPTNIRNKAKLLLSHIDQSACLTWDSLLHIIIEGKVLNRTNIADLLKYVLQTGRAPSFVPNNLIEFLCCLKKANVPQTLLNVTARKKMLTIKSDDVNTEQKGGSDVDSTLAHLNVDTFSVPPPGLKSLEKKNKKNKTFVWLDY